MMDSASLATGESVSERPRYARLEQFLRTQIAQRPADPVPRVKLLELLFESSRAADFLAEAQALRGLSRPGIDPPGWPHVSSMGRSLQPDALLFSDVSELELMPDSAPRAAHEPAPAPHKRIGESVEFAVLFSRLACEYSRLRADATFLGEIDRELVRFSGRPTPLLHARRLSQHLGGAQLFFKREDLAPGAITLGTAMMGQGLFAKRLGRRRLVTGSVQGHRGVMMAAVAAHLGLEAVVFMNGEEMRRQRGNVLRMQLFGAEVHPVEARHLRSGDVREAAMRHWLRFPEDSFMVMGLDGAMEPYPSLVRDSVTAVGRECAMQMRAQMRRAPDLVAVRAGNNGDAIGMLPAFLAEASTRLACIECTADLPEPASSQRESVSVRASELNNDQRRVAEAILEGLEYPSVAREHAWLKSSGKVEYRCGNPAEAVDAICMVSRFEGLVPAIQTAQVIAWAMRESAHMRPEQAVVIGYNERSDKDLWDIGRACGMGM